MPATTEEKPAAEASSDEPKSKKSRTLDDGEEKESVATEQPPTKEEAEKFILEHFLLSMPDDFFAFWDFCRERNHANPLEALAPTLGLRLVGPFEAMAGKLQKAVTAAKEDEESETVKEEEFLRHWRYFFDVPEFQTVLAAVDEDDGKENLFHIGYFRDDSGQAPVFVASSNPKDSCRLTILGENLFAAVYNHTSQELKKADPFKQSALQKLKESIHVFATMKVQSSDFSLDQRTQRMKARDKLRLAPLFHGAGMVVPYDKEKELGYREIPETTASLKKIFKNVVEAGDDEDAKIKAMDVLQELITNVQFANDEGDPGMGLELGLNAFLYGGRGMERPICHLLELAYELLSRGPFAKVAKAHMADRREGKPFKITC